MFVHLPTITLPTKPKKRFFLNVPSLSLVACSGGLRQRQQGGDGDATTMAMRKAMRGDGDARTRTVRNNYLNLNNDDEKIYLTH
jgi:hypothetical protein